MSSTILDLDHAINAFDQRAMPTALARLYLFMGMVFLLVGLLPPMTPAYFWIAIGALFAGLVLIIPFWYPRKRWIAWLGGGAALLLACLLIQEAVTVVTPLARLSLPFQVDKALSDAISVANQSYSQRSWIIPRALGALPIFLFACELLVAAFLLFRLNQHERNLLVPRSNKPGSVVLECLFDISPGFVEYSRGYPRWRTSWLIAIFPFALALTNIVGARVFENLFAVTRLVDCIDSGAQMPSCFDQYLPIHTLGMFIMTAVSIPLLIWIGTLLTNRLKKRLAKHNHSQQYRANQREANAKDAANTVLFLRSSDDDSVVLPRPAWTPMRYALAPSMRLTPDLDSLMVGELMTYRTPIGLGAKEQQSFGAHRILVSDPDKIEDGLESWKRKVISYAKAAIRIVIVVDETVDPEWSIKREGLRWELELLASEPELLKKTTIIVKTDKVPRTKQGKHATLLANRALWDAIRTISENKIDVPHTDKPLMSLSFSDDMSSLATTASRLTSTTARLVLRSAFRLDEPLN